MANLNIENLSGIANTGEVERLFEDGQRIAPNELRSNKALMNDPDAKSVVSSNHGQTFSDILRDSVDKVNQYQNQADTAIKELVAGRSKNIHETMLTVERADTSLKLMMQVRNKILDAYREIMRMQV